VSGTLVVVHDLWSRRAHLCVPA